MKEYVTFQNPYKLFRCSNLMDFKNEFREIAEGIIIAVVLYLIIQACFMVTLGVEKPLYVVVSGSMEPVYKEGDILLVGRADVDRIEKGDIIVFHSPSGGIPVVHRVYEVKTEGGRHYFITKGDSNPSTDFYYQHDPYNYLGIPPEKIIGKPLVKIPKLGWAQIWLRQFLSWVHSALREFFELLQTWWRQLIDVIRCPYLKPV